MLIACNCTQISVSYMYKYTHHVTIMVVVKVSKSSTFFISQVSLGQAPLLLPQGGISAFEGKHVRFNIFQTWKPGCNCSLALDNSSASSLKTFNSEAAASISWLKKRYTLAVHEQVHDHAHAPQTHISEIIKEGAKRTYATFTLHNTLMMHAMYTNMQHCMFRNMPKRSRDFMQFPLYILKSLHSLNSAKTSSSNKHAI